MAYDAWGKGPGLVLLCGLGCDGRMWGSMLDRMGTSFRVIVPHSWKASTMVETAAMVAGAIKDEGMDQAFIAGLSMGGYGVFETLRLYPELVRAAALMDTTAFPDDQHRVEKRLQVLGLLEKGKFEEVLAPFIKSVLWKEGPRILLAEEAILTTCRELGPEVYRRSMEAIMNRGDYLDVLSNSDKPMLFLAGEHDMLTPPQTAATMAATAKNAQSYLIPDAAHMTPVENPGAVAHALESFLLNFLEPNGF